MARNRFFSWPAPEKIAKTIAAASIVALLAALVVTYFVVEICDQQATAKGAVVEVCRHPSTSDPPMIAVILAIVALLAGVFFAEVSVFGITFKRELTQVREATEAAKDQAEELREDLKVAQSDLYESVDRLRSGRTEPEPTMPPDVVGRLAQEYNQVRLALPSGGERTATMEQIAERLEAELRERPDVDPVPYLNSSDRGIRLAGYAALRVRAHPQLVPRIADAALGEDKPFGQLWALKALKKQLTFAPFALDSASADRLQSILGTIPHRTDRAVLVRDILQRYAKLS